MISASLHCVVSLWVLLKACFSFAFSWRSLLSSQSPTTNTGRDGGDPLPQPTLQDIGLPTRDDGICKLDTAQNSIERAQWRTGMYEKGFFVVGKASIPGHTIPNDDTVERGDIHFSTASALMDLLDPYDVKDASQDLFAKGYDTPSDSSSAPKQPNSLSNVMTGLEGDNVLNDSLVHDILSGLDSEADLSTNYDADTSDDFLECTTPNWGFDGITAPDSSWKHDVATAMHAFRSCKADNDDMLALLPEVKQRFSLHIRRISQGKQLQEIQDWRNDFRNECDVSSKSELLSDSDYTLITTFRFP